jgi:tripartite-type tricarboxylate transporter receptor subunit TctC
VTTAERSTALPGMPTMSESGVKETLPKQWWGIAEPEGMPAPIVTRLNSEIGRIVAMPDVKERYNDLGISPLHTTPDRMLETIRAEAPKMAKILAAIGLKPE